LELRPPPVDVLIVYLLPTRIKINLKGMHEKKGKDTNG
jgi:hypothetical protein